MEGIFAGVPWDALGRIPRTVESQGREISDLRKELERMQRIWSSGVPNVGGFQKHEDVKPEAHDAYPEAPGHQAPVYQAPTYQAPVHQVPPHEADMSQTMGERQKHVSSKPLADTAESGSQSPGDFDHHQQEHGSDEDDPGTLPPRQEPTIPLGHTTEAANLLEKPGVAPLIQGIIGPKYAIKNVRYAAEQERRRGQLRFFGRGEGIDVPPGYEKDSASDHLSDSTPGETHSENSSPAGEYERGGILSPPNFSQEPVIEEYTLDRKLDFSEETVKALVQSYKDNINNMHPIFTFSHIDKMVQHFMRTHARSRPTPTSYPTAAFVGPTSPWDMESPGNKRKRSPAGEPQDLLKGSGQQRLEYPSRPVDRTPNTGLVLLILALGKVCLHTAKLPDAAYTFSPEYARTNPRFARNGHPSSPIQNSPSFPSTSDMNYRSRRQSTEGTYSKMDLSKMNNMDLVPGLDYFAYATDIIGNQLGGNRLQHVHLGLLAGLYHGQLGRVVDSHAFIFQASRCLQEVLKK